MAEGFADDFRRSFLRGLAAVLPTIVTVMIIVYLFRFVDNYLGRFINTAVQWVAVQFYCLTGHRDRQWAGSADAWNAIKPVWSRYHLSWVGTILAFVAVYVLGRFVASYVGKMIWRTIERALFRAPVVKQIYPYVKQVTDFLFSQQKVQFSRVVAVEYPRKGVWSMGLVTAPGMRTLNGTAGMDLLTIFIPSSPTPVTGYTITVRREEVIDLPMSIDDALRFTVSGGVIMPTNQRMSPDEVERARQGVFGPIGKETAS